MAIPSESSGWTADGMATTQKRATLQQAATQTESVLTRRNLVISVALFALALIAIALFDHHYHINLLQPSHSPHFVYQAQALLQGHWDIALPLSATDVILLHGKHYIIYPPFPAIALMPFVAIWGLQTSDVLFTAVVAALGVSFLYLMFEQARANGLTTRPWLHHALMTLLLFFGSIYWWLSLGGSVWFTAQILCVVSTLIGLFLGLRRKYFAASLLLMCAFFSRPTAIFGFIFLLALAWDDAGLDPHLARFLTAPMRALRERSLRAIELAAIPWRRLAPVLATIALLFALYGVHNALIFGSPFETGYDILMRQRYPQIHYGQFSWRYVPANIIANFFNFPIVKFSGPWDLRPTIDMTNGDMSISVFLTTPLFLLLFWKNRTRSVLRGALWLTIIFVVIEVLFFNASGWAQFGARYLFDGYPYAFLLLALNDTPFDWRFVALGLLGVGINMLGAIAFWAHHIFRL